MYCFWLIIGGLLTAAGAALTAADEAGEGAVVIGVAEVGTGLVDGGD